jgi:low density lipoprotein receptor-related protein 5/6
LSYAAVAIDLKRIIFLRSLSDYKSKIVEKVLINYITCFLYFFIVEPLRLLYSERRNIRLLHVDGDRRSQNNFTTTVLAKNLEDAIAVAFHYQDQILFWTDVSLGKILRKSIKKDSRVEIVVSVGLVRPEGIAIDWVTKKIYWTDSHLKLIEVVNLDGTQRSVLFWNNLDQPRAIVVDPSHG